MTLFINCEDNPITFNKKNYLMRAAERLGISVKDFRDSGEQEYVLNIEPYTLAKGTRWTGIWEIDLLCDRANTGPDWAYADTVFVAGSAIPARLHKDLDKVTLLFQAADLDLHKRRPEIDQIYDFVICGSMNMPRYKKREEAYEILKQHFTYQGFDNNQKPSDYVGILNTARVQFVRSMSSDIADGEIAQRFFECLAIGPVLTNYVPDLEYTGLVEGQDYEAYRNEKEMLEKMKMLIEDPSLRYCLYRNALRKVQLYHTYEHRLITILHTIKEYENKSARG